MTFPKFLYSIYAANLTRKLEKEDLPKHIGIIHDGHRRYAREKGLLSYEVSYRIGMKTFRECVMWCNEFDIEHLTSWLLSKENLERPREELDPYFKVLEELFKDLIIDDLFDNYKIQFIGSTQLLPHIIKDLIKKVESIRSYGDKELTIALGYGGRQEILDAVKSLIEERYDSSQNSKDLKKHITDQELRRHLYSPESPDIDLVIRTSGEARLSGFLLWQSAYSEFVFKDVYWPAFRKIDFLRCLREYVQRERRFGQ